MISAYAPGYVAPLLAGDDGTEQTIDAIRSLVDDAWKDSSIRRAAIDMLQASGVPDFASDAQKAQSIYNWVLANKYFVNDPVTKEVLLPASDLLQNASGDCDDINAVLLPSLIGSVGIEPRLVTISANPGDPTTFSHIYSEAFLDGAWVALDAARPGAQFGSAPGMWYRREWWSLVDGSHEPYPGSGQIGMSGAWRPGSARLRGLGDLTSLYDVIAQDASSLVNTAEAPAGVVYPAYGPGGTLLTAQATPIASASISAPSGLVPLLIIGVVGFILLEAIL
jgi:hypothetical protein